MGKSISSKIRLVAAIGFILMMMILAGCKGGVGEGDFKCKKWGGMIEGYCLPVSGLTGDPKNWDYCNKLMEDLSEEDKNMRRFGERCNADPKCRYSDNADAIKKIIADEIKKNKQACLPNNGGGEGVVAAAEGNSYSNTNTDTCNSDILAISDYLASHTDITCVTETYATTETTTNTGTDTTTDTATGSYDDSDSGYYYQTG